MGRKCKCKNCGAELTTDTAYLWIHTTEKTQRNFYFCNENEYISYVKKKENNTLRKIRIDNCINNIIGYANKNTVLFKAEQDWLKINNALEVIEEHAEWISDILRWKGFDNFSSEYNLIKYLCAVINNNLNDWVKEFEQKQEYEEYLTGKVDENYTEVKAKSHQKRKRKCLDDFEGE